MEIIYEKYGTIVAFMIMCLLIQTMLGNDILNQFLVLVLASMIVLNADSFIDMIGGI